MKKVGIVLFLIILLSSLILAEEFGDEDVNKIVDTSNKIKTTTEGKQNWTVWKENTREMFSNNTILGPIYKTADKTLVIISPFWLGMPFILSWKWIYALLLWLLIFIGIGRILSSYGPLSKATSWLIGLALAIILSMTKVIEKSAQGLDSIFSTWWGDLIISLIICSFFFLIFNIGKILKIQAQKLADMNADTHRLILKKAAEMENEALDTLLKK